MGRFSASTVRRGLRKTGAGVREGMAVAAAAAVMECCAREVIAANGVAVIGVAVIGALWFAVTRVGGTTPDGTFRAEAEQADSTRPIARDKARCWSLGFL